MIAFPLAQTGEGIAECELIQWFVNKGDEIKRFEKICEVQSDKASVEITSPYDGTVVGGNYSVGDIAKVGDPLCDIAIVGDLPKGAVLSKAGGAATAPAAAESATAPAGTGTGGDSSGAADAAGEGRGYKCSPAVRRLARDSGIDLADVASTGPNGRILKGDVISHLENLSGGGETAPNTAAHTAPPALSASVEDAVVPLRGYDRAMAKAMTAASAVPHLLFCEEIEMDNLMEARARLKGSDALQGAKLTYMPFLIKALSVALADFPRVNAQFGKDEASVLIKGAHNIGVAMATPTGLVVPNVKNVERRSISEIAQELARLQDLAGRGKLAQEDVTGGTITISNIGTVGGTYAAPIINVPEAAIVALGRVRRVPTFAADGVTIEARSVMNVSWSADHRVVDGETIARFCNAWKMYLQEPERLLLRTR